MGFDVIACGGAEHEAKKPPFWLYLGHCKAKYMRKRAGSQQSPAGFCVLQRWDYLEIRGLKAVQFFAFKGWMILLHPSLDVFWEPPHLPYSKSPPMCYRWLWGSASLGWVSASPGWGSASFGRGSGVFMGICNLR